MFKFAGQAWLVLVVSAGSGVVLGGLEKELGPRIADNERRARAEAAVALIAGAATAQEETIELTGKEPDPNTGAVPSMAAYRVSGADGQLLGWAVPGEGRGYGSDPIKLMIGLSADARAIVDYKVLSSTETPGLGSKIGDRAFRQRFAGKSAATHLQPAKKSGGLGDNEVQALTGATISSKAVCDILYRQLAETGLAEELARRSATTR